MVFRDRQGLSSDDPIQSTNNRDRYLDNCFLLCMNRNDDTDTPEIYRLENNLLQELYTKNPSNQMKSQQQQQSRIYLTDKQEEQNYNIDDDDEDILNSRQQQQKERDYIYRRKDNQQDRDSHRIKNRTRYQRDDGMDRYQYSRPVRYNHRDDYNIMQHSDDELSVYEIYVPTNTLNRLSNKQIDNNMVLIDYEDASMMRNVQGMSSPYGYSPQNIPSQYNNYMPINQYNDYGQQYQYDPSFGFPRERDDQQKLYQNNPLQQQQPQQQFGGYYGNEGNRQPYLPEPVPFLPPNIPIDRSNVINVRRHIYSPSQLPQGLTEGQLVMLLQKGNQYQPEKSQPLGQQTQLFPTQNEPQPSTMSAITVSQSSPAPSTHIVEPFKNPEYVAPLQIKIPPQVLPQIIDHRLTDEERVSITDDITKPMNTLNTMHSTKPMRDIESEEKKKDKTSDVKKDKKAEKDIGDSHKRESKKDGKKEKSSGKDSKKKKK
ncbi:unnamed protein product [Adineta steineri]|uniref:Uncharacterized protein n=1 Tax=Adineta steineri TaxID=433720 RepID=A0A813Z545_9BILA|nr:unnamed protein product [Adineta steineri]